MSKSQHDSTLSPGPPLPKGHPSPGLLAKLYLFTLDNYSSALTLIKPSATKASTDQGSEVTAALRRYISDEIAVSSGLSHKWLGIESGEAGRSGEAIAYLMWAREELENAKGGKVKSILSQGGKRNKEMKTERNDRVVEEYKVVKSFLDDYTKENNNVGCLFLFGL